MRLGLVYDLRDDYRALGFSEEATAEFDSRETIDALDTSLTRLGWNVCRIGRGQELAKRLVAGDRCAGCFRADGTPKSQDEITDELTAYLIESLDLSQRAAREIAVRRISKLPAWRPDDLADGAE